jgi:hypothetical protein
MPADMKIEADRIIIYSVISNLFHTVIRNVQNSVILFSEKVYGMSVLMQVKSKGNISHALPEDIGPACLKAQESGGIIEMIRCESEQTSMAYCFLNTAEAA